MFAAILLPFCSMAGTLGFGDIAGMGRLDIAEGAPCCVTGVVSYAAAWIENSGIVTAPGDPNGFGVWFSGDVNGVVVRLEGADRIRPGQTLEIFGSASRLGFAPGIKADSIKVLSEGASLPPPPEYRLRDCDWGVMDNRRATLRGVLMDAKTNSLPGFASCRVGTSDGDFIAHIPGDSAHWLSMVDSEIVISGIALSIFNIRGEFIGVQMDALSAGDVQVTQKAVAFEDVPEVSLVDMLPYSGHLASPHRRRVKGTVTLVKEGEIVYLQSADGALRVRTTTKGLVPGDEVEAVGFPRIESRMGLLAFAEVRKTGTGKIPEPLQITERELLVYPIKEDGGYENLDARLVTLEGRLLAADGVNLSVAVGDTRIYVALSELLDEKVLDAVGEIEPMLRLTGTLSLSQNPELPEGRVPSIAQWRLDAAADGGAVLVEDSAWRGYMRAKTLREALAVASGVGVLLLLVLLVRYVRFQNAYRRMDILAKERKRMAADLHDTIEQNLLSAKLLLQTSLSMDDSVSDQVRGAVESAQEILMSAKKEIRETIFNLRNDELFARKSEDVLKSVARRIGESGIAKVRVNLRGLPDKLPGAMFSDIIYIIKEAATNAVKHGGAKNVFVVSDPLEGGGFALRIVNDGAPFDPSRSPGPNEGHFGLTGMRERAIRNGIGFSIDVEKGMTAVRLEVKR